MQIVQYPHPALRHKSKPLPMIDRKVHLIAGQMLDLMYEAHGLGLAANQVNWPFQMLVMNDLADPEQKDHEFVLINPVILERKGTQDGDEGCLSFPELFQKVRRAKSVVVQAYNLEGKVIELSAVDLAARLLQHEIDHLQGVLFIDNMGTIARLASRGYLRTFERDYRKAQERGEIPPDDTIIRELKEMEDGFGKEEPPVM
jgi:peptide deformylase